MPTQEPPILNSIRQVAHEAFAERQAEGGKPMNIQIGYTSRFCNPDCLEHTLDILMEDTARLKFSYRESEDRHAVPGGKAETLVATVACNNEQIVKVQQDFNPNATIRSNAKLGEFVLTVFQRTIDVLLVNGWGPDVEV